MTFQLNALTNWFAINPRRVIATLILVALTIALVIALLPSATVLAGPATGGSS
jgi:hypothetical protein